MSVGSRIKELRESKGMSRNDLAAKLGVTVGSISNYENEVSSPKEPILFKIMDALGCDANYLFQDSMCTPTLKRDVSVKEFSLIKKYRALDQHGREMVDFTIQKEWERSTLNTQSFANEVNSTESSDKPEQKKSLHHFISSNAVAAHAEDNVADADIEFDNAIMGDDKEWGNAKGRKRD